MYKLHFLINVFGVSPTFLLPVFKKENNYFFQVIENGKIVSFEKADLQQFNDCKRYYIKSLTYMVYEDCSPVFSIETPDCHNYYIGKQIDILYYFECNKDKYQKFDHFCHSMENFKKNDFKSDNKSGLTVFSKENKYISPLDIKKLLIETHHCGVFTNYEQILSNSYTRIREYMLLGGNTRKKTLKSIERENKHILFNLNSCFECDNVFDIFEIVNSKKQFRIHPIIVNNKLRSNIPLSIQIDILKTIYRKKFVFSSNEINYFCSEGTYINGYFFITENDIKKMLKKDWNLNIAPKKNMFNLYDNTNSIIESKNTFYFGVKKISKKDYAIIAEDILSNELYFSFNDVHLKNDDTISFIEYLYSKTGHTVNLIPCCDESKIKIFNDDFSRWLGLNEDICLIKGLQNFVGTHF